MLIKHKINNNQNNQHFYKKDEIFNNYLGAFKVILTYIYVNSLILCLDCMSLYILFVNYMLYFH